jgi:biopolymer transport protein ExbD
MRIFLRADKSVPYGELMRVMNLLRAGGYLKVALVGLEGFEDPTAPSLPPDADTSSRAALPLANSTPRH